MKIGFKVPNHPTEAVKAVVDCFDGQPLATGLSDRIDPGRMAAGQQARLEMDQGFRNNDLRERYVKPILFEALRGVNLAG
jgi:type III restriction enzyme